MKFADSFKNFLANLGTDRDKASGAAYYDNYIDDGQLSNAYRFNWLPKKIVDIPPLDSTRKWRKWQADSDQISAIEAEENRLGLKQKVLSVQRKARLFGGAGIYISIKGDRDPSKEIKPESLKQGGIDFLTVLPKRVLQAQKIETDPASKYYGKPSMYRITSGTAQIDIHPSRIAAFIGNPLPDEDIQTGSSAGWGDSSLAASLGACTNADATLANIVSLIYEAKVDVLGVPNLADIMADEESRSALVARVHLAAMLKGNNGMLVRDAEETYDSKSFNFGNLDSIGNLMLQVVSGAADIPTTRLLGMSPGGMNASGESDLRNYYDRIQSAQELEITPAMSILDECLIQSALGSRPKDIFYVWSSLWQSTEKERADNGKVVADTIKVIVDTRLFPEDALSKAAENTLTEWGVLPGLEAAMNDYGEWKPEEEIEEDKKKERGLMDSTQPRVPAGSPEGGQFAEGQGGGGLSASSAEAINDYTGEGHKAINRQLRGVNEATPEVSARILALDSALDGRALTETVTLYRGISGVGAQKILASNPKKGTVLDDPGFMSVTKNTQVARTFANQSSNQVTMVISAKKGAKAFDISVYSDAGSSESEILFARGSRLKVVKYDSSKKIIYAETVDG